MTISVSSIGVRNTAALGKIFPTIQTSLPYEAKELSSKINFADLLGTALHKDLVQLESAVVAGKSPSIRELLLYQIKANELNIRVELVSKLAESVMTSVRKLQSNQ